MYICSQNEIICCILNLLKSLRLLLDPITNLCLHWEMANHMKMKFEWLCCFGLFHDDQKRGKRASFYDINLHYFESGYMTLKRHNTIPPFLFDPAHICTRSPLFCISHHTWMYDNSKGYYNNKKYYDNHPNRKSWAWLQCYNLVKKNLSKIKPT